MSTATETKSAVSVRHDFVLVFDVTDGNPNGDPDAGNMPRIDPETTQGLMTDVALKRKVRDAIFAAKGDVAPYRIYVQHQSRGGAFLNKLHGEALDAVGVSQERSVRANPPIQQRESARQWMCRNFYDVRAFGAVMSTGQNAGQVRGPVQITFARSVDPVVPTEYAITRVAKTTEAGTEKGGTTEMGRKYALPYGLYVAHGFVSASFAKDTGFSEEDLGLLWEALAKMFWDDRSAARGEMETRGLYVFRHRSALGEAPASRLFELVKIERRDTERPARAFSDYEVTIGEPLPEGVELLRLVG